VSDQLLFHNIIVVSLVEGETREQRHMGGGTGGPFWLRMPKLTIHSTHCRENVVTRGER